MKRNTKKNLLKVFWENQTGGISGLLLVVVIIIVVLASLGIGFGLGKGTGKGVGNGEGESQGQEYIPDGEKDEVVDDVIPSDFPTVTLAPKEFSVIVDRTEILFDNEKFSNAQSLIDVIQKKVEAGDSILIILHDENAIADTLEDVKNALDRNKILWVTPTPTLKE